MAKIGAGLSALAATAAGAAGAATHVSNVEAIIDNPLTNYSMTLDERVEHVERAEECRSDLTTDAQAAYLTGACAAVMPIAIGGLGTAEGESSSMTSYLNYDPVADSFSVHSGVNANLDMDQAISTIDKHIKISGRDVTEQRAGAIAGNAFFAGAVMLGTVWVLTVGKG